MIERSRVRFPLTMGDFDLSDTSDLQIFVIFEPANDEIDLIRDSLSETQALSESQACRANRAMIS